MSRARRPSISVKLSLCALVTACASLPRGSAPEALREAAAPTRGEASSIGRYDAGCLAGARALPLTGDGYVVMRPSRNRFYGHPDLLAFLDRLASSFHARGYGELLIGDLGQPRGGPMISGHASHQVGLDVDLWFQTAERSVAELARETMPAASVLDNATATGRALDPVRFGPAQLELLKLASADPAVERIFVNPAIKLSLCARPGEKSWLARLRPWPGHEEHFHVRLRCPAGSALCVPQTPPPAGDGCAEAGMLADYFRATAEKERRDAAAGKPPAPHLEPRLPEECAAVIAAERP